MTLFSMNGRGKQMMTTVQGQVVQVLSTNKKTYRA